MTKMAGSKYVEQPGINDEKELNSAINNEADVVTIPGTRRNYKVKWLKQATTRKITSILHHTKSGDDDKISCKVAVAIVLNDYWKIMFLYWITWRWFYYVRQYGDAQLLPLILEGKKKVPQEEFLTNTMLAIGMRDTIMTMTKAEVERFLQERPGGHPTT